MVALAIKKLIRSFIYASEGIVYTINTQRNMKIHVFVALTVLLGGMWLHFSSTETIYILFAIGIVFAAEIFNTAIEKTIDLITKGERHEFAKVAKDTAAGAVLFLTMVAVSIGILVIQPYLNLAISGGWSIKVVHPSSFFILEGFFIIIVTYSLKAYWYSKNRQLEPNLFIGIVLFLLALSSSINFWMLIPLSIISGLLLIYFYQKGYYKLLGFIQNILISVGGFYLLYRLFY